MLIDHRTYRIKPGFMNQHLALYEEHGLKAQWKHLGEPLTYMFAESGAMNSLVHQWVYKDAADRAGHAGAEMMKGRGLAGLRQEARRLRPLDGPADLADGAGQVPAAAQAVMRPARRARSGESE